MPPLPPSSRTFFTPSSTMSLLIADKRLLESGNEAYHTIILYCIFDFYSQGTRLRTAGKSRRFGNGMMAHRHELYLIAQGVASTTSPISSGRTGSDGATCSPPAARYGST
jgi:hypothetical protein